MEQDMLYLGGTVTTRKDSALMTYAVPYWSSHITIFSDFILKTV